MRKRGQGQRGAWVTAVSVVKASSWRFISKVWKSLWSHGGGTLQVEGVMHSGHFREDIRCRKRKNIKVSRDSTYSEPIFIQRFKVPSQVLTSFLNLSSNSNTPY